MSNPFKVVVRAEAEAWEVGHREAGGDWQIGLGEDDALIEWADGWVVRQPGHKAQLLLLDRGKDAPRELHAGDVLIKDIPYGNVSLHQLIGPGGAKTTLYWERTDQ